MTCVGFFPKKMPASPANALAPLVIVAATGMEMAAVFQGLGITVPLPTRDEPRAMTHAGQRLVFALTGVGPVNAGIAGGRLVEGFSPKGMLCLGIAGTYAPSTVPLGSAVVATREIWPEYGLATACGVDAKALGFPQWGNKNDTSPLPVWNSIDIAAEASFAAMGLPCLPAAVPCNAGNPPVLSGASITVAGVTGTKERARELYETHAAVTENMEGFALALTAQMTALPFGEIRTVSNIVGERSPDAWNIPAALAALGCVARLLLQP